MKQTEIKMTIRFIESILGSLPKDKTIFENYVAAKAPTQENKEEEIESFNIEDVERGVSIFSKTDAGDPFLYDYQVKGYFKDTCGGLRRIAGTESSKLKAYKQIIDKLIFIKDRRNIIKTDKPLTMCQRPLRASTPMGERITLVASEEIQAGATMEFTIVLLDSSYTNVVKEWMDYGRMSGMGQWRNSGHGKFEIMEMIITEVNN